MGSNNSKFDSDRDEYFNNENNIYDTGYSTQIVVDKDINPNNNSTASSNNSRSNSNSDFNSDSNSDLNSDKNSNRSINSGENKGPFINVQLYSKKDFKGDIFEIDSGNYPSDMFVKALSPNNVFSLTIPPKTNIKLYSGNEYDFGKNGGMSITNTSSDIMKIESLPSNIRGRIKSVSIVNLANINNSFGIGDGSFIKTDKADIIASDMVNRTKNLSNLNKEYINENYSNSDTNYYTYHYNENLATILSYPEIVVLFYIFLLIIVIYMIYDR